MTATDTEMPEAQTEPCPACASLLDVTGAKIFAERTCPVCGTPINVRRNFGHYELVGIVGSGGQGVVYRAVDNNLNRLVALKLLRTEYSQDAEFVKQFEAEARITASINHPNVVRVYSFGADEGHVFLAMELVDKGTLDELMEKHGRVPEARMLQIGIEIAQGLRAGAEKGLIHRDVKPGNILFAQDGTSKIVDFGLALFFEQAGQGQGEIWGTPYYLSPERLNKAPEDFRSDIYSLGATLFHAVAGRPPFEAEDASHVALKHLRAQAVSVQAFAPDVGNATAYVINRTLAKDVRARQQSYDELIEQLQFARTEALARARGGGGQKQARVVIEDQKMQKAMSWVTLATLGILVAGLIVAGLLIAKVFKKDGDDGPAAPGVAAAALDAFGPGWAAARDALLGGSYATAAQAFKDLAAKHEAGTTQKAWALVNQALAEQFAGQQERAAATLGQLAGGGTQVSKFFNERVAPRLSGTQPVPGVEARDLGRSSHEILAALFFARKNYALGAVDDARSFVSAFTGMSPGREVAWLDDYRKLAKPIQDEFTTYSLAADSWTLARNAADRQIALAALRELPAKLPAASPLRKSAADMLAAAEKQIADEHAERMKSNLAYRAAATASGYDQQKGEVPANAVDGDYKTRWVVRAPGEKWLALNLGGPKQISRWVVRTAGAAGEKPENNFASLTLQRSDDGRSWSDVDSIMHNRSDITDRVVKPFTAPHVRIFSSQGAVKAGDNSLRIFELELSATPDQSKAAYGSADAVAMRFSAETDFIAGPVGDPGVTGSVKYDAAARKYTVQAGGADVWGTSDGFHFVWQPVQGDCEIVARVTKIEQKHDWTKAGVMIRNSLADFSMHGSAFCGPGGKAQFVTRKSPGGTSRSDNRAGLPLPRWVKVVRSGTTITGYVSADGKGWNVLGKETLETAGDVMFVGLATCSHVAGVLATAEYDSVTITKK